MPHAGVLLVGLPQFKANLRKSQRESQLLATEALSVPNEHPRAGLLPNPHDSLVRSGRKNKKGRMFCATWLLLKYLFPGGRWEVVFSCSGHKSPVQLLEGLEGQLAGQRVGAAKAGGRISPCAEGGRRERAPGSHGSCYLFWGPLGPFPLRLNSAS